MFLLRLLQISDFTLQLVPQLPPSSLSSFSCGHVIPRDNLLTLVLPMGPKGRELEFKFAARGDEALVRLASLPTLVRLCARSAVK